MQDRHRSTSILQPTAIMILGRTTAGIGVVHGFRSVSDTGAAIGVVIMAVAMVDITAAGTTVTAIAEATTVAAITWAMVEGIAAVVVIQAQVARSVRPVAVVQLDISVEVAQGAPPASVVRLVPLVGVAPLFILAVGVQPDIQVEAGQSVLPA